MAKGRPWRSYKVRTCCSMHECALCNKDILLGQTYYDGGYGRRAHEDCVRLLTPEGRDPKTGCEPGCTCAEG